MQARPQLAFGPEEIKQLWAAFDATWEVAKLPCSDNPQSIEATRLKVANAVLAAWREGPSDLKAASLEMMERWA
jgi:hypothetical protein